MKPAPDSQDFEQLIEQVIDHGVRHVDKGGLPFTALVADERGHVVASGVNRVMEDSDPTAHAEVVAIREAGKRRRSPSLAGMTLIASGEPCAMCYMSVLFAGIDRIIFAVDRHGAAKAGFDYRDGYGFFRMDPIDWPIEVRQQTRPRALRPFTHWQRKSQQR